MKYPPEHLRDNLRHLDRRQWWLWSTTFALILLLTLAVASFAFPALLKPRESTYSFYLNQAVRALVGLVLVFSVYLIYQQHMLSKLRNQLADQINSLAKVESSGLGGLQARRTRSVDRALQSPLRRTAPGAGNQPRAAPRPPAHRSVDGSRWLEAD